MDNLYKEAKAFIECIKIRIVQDKDNNIKMDGDNYISYSISITNPRNELSMTYTILNENMTIRNDKFVQFKIIMNLLLNYLYRSGDPYSRDKFSTIFNETDTMLMIQYFKYFPCFKKAVIDLSG